MEPYFPAAAGHTTGVSRAVAVKNGNVLWKNGARGGRQIRRCVSGVALAWATRMPIGRNGVGKSTPGFFFDNTIVIPDEVSRRRKARTRGRITFSGDAVTKGGSTRPLSTFTTYGVTVLRPFLTWNPTLKSEVNSRNRAAEMYGVDSPYR
jgi:hypothetical protein